MAAAASNQHTVESILPDTFTGGRRTINSLTTHTAVYNEHIPPPNSQLRIPVPPSRSPTPPTEVIPHNRGGNKFTPEDRRYFIRFIQWRLTCDPTLLRNELCELLAAKVSNGHVYHRFRDVDVQTPHHNRGSWGAYWSTHHDLPDKILASMRESSQCREPELITKSLRKPNYYPSDSELTELSDEEEPTDSTKGQKGGFFTKGGVEIEDCADEDDSGPNKRGTNPVAPLSVPDSVGIQSYFAQLLDEMRALCADVADLRAKLHATVDMQRGAPVPMQIQNNAPANLWVHPLQHLICEEDSSKMDAARHGSTCMADRARWDIRAFTSIQAPPAAAEHIGDDDSPDDEFAVKHKENCQIGLA
ncbi:hypothetical protein B0H14DRAFT_3891339 [Mycena olivaceomarginata]|nr:hypothetical protein B0H14DRAFT_3891339 [Mycena olivaceomarginata]